MDPRAEAEQCLARLSANLDEFEKAIDQDASEDDQLRKTVAELETRVDRLERIFASLWGSLP
jgi:septal ring factor EnvC (AmiA/AmiB activator)